MEEQIKKMDRGTLEAIAHYSLWMTRSIVADEFDGFTFNCLKREFGIHGLDVEEKKTSDKVS